MCLFQAISTHMNIPQQRSIISTMKRLPFQESVEVTTQYLCYSKKSLDVLQPNQTFLTVAWDTGAPSSTQNYLAKN